MPETKDKSLGEVHLRNVRISFAHVYQPQEGRMDDKTKEKGEDRYNANFLMSKTDEQGKRNIAQLKAVGAKVKEAKWPGDPAKQKLKADRVCLKDGDEESYDGYEGHYYLTASNKEKPVLISNTKDEKGKWNPSPKGEIYSGCYVNALVRLWAMDNQFGRRLNASLEAVQFLRDGEAFGRKPVDPDEAFKDVPEGEGRSAFQGEEEDEDAGLI